MAKVKYLIPLWVAIVIYVVCSLITGPVGFSTYRQLLVEREKLTAHLEKLKERNRTLENTKDALLRDRETIALYARELGYSAEGEKFIRIVGREVKAKQETEAGHILPAAPPSYLSDEVIKFFACFMGLGLFICILVPDLLEKRSRRRDRVSEEPSFYEDVPYADSPDTSIDSFVIVEEDEENEKSKYVI